MYRQMTILEQRPDRVIASCKQARVMKTPLTPPLYSKTGVYRGIHYFSFENEHFYSREMLLYIALACLRHGELYKGTEV